MHKFTKYYQRIINSDQSVREFSQILDRLSKRDKIAFLEYLGNKFEDIPIGDIVRDFWIERKYDNIEAEDYLEGNVHAVDMAVKRWNSQKQSDLLKIHDSLSGRIDYWNRIEKDQKSMYEEIIDKLNNEIEFNKFQRKSSNCLLCRNYNFVIGLYEALLNGFIDSQTSFTKLLQVFRVNDTPFESPIKFERNTTLLAYLFDELKAAYYFNNDQYQNVLDKNKMFMSNQNGSVAST